jgi:hypothetical protein
MNPWIVSIDASSIKYPLHSGIGKGLSGSGAWANVGGIATYKRVMEERRICQDFIATMIDCGIENPGQAALYSPFRNCFSPLTDAQNPSVWYRPATRLRGVVIERLTGNSVISGMPPAVD